MKDGKARGLGPLNTEVTSRFVVLLRRKPRAISKSCTINLKTLFAISVPHSAPIILCPHFNSKVTLRTNVLEPGVMKLKDKALLPYPFYVLARTLNTLSTNR